MSENKKEISHWKSLEELHQDPEFLEQNANEFSEGSPSRRNFLKAMGFTLATASLVACSRSPIHKAIPFLNKPEELTPGVANWYATTCAACSAGCSLLVKSRDGRPIKVEGNPDSPLTAGGVCVVGQASLLGLYDENRLPGPLWSGEGVTWGHLDEQTRNRLKEISQGPGKIVLLTGTVLSPTTHQLIKDFLAPFPQSQHIQYDALSAYGIRVANQKSFNKSVVPNYRFDKAKLIIGINADFLGAWISPVEFTHRYIQNRKLKKPIPLSKHIQLESDFTLTGSNADERIPIQASQEGEVVLGLIKNLQALANGSEAPSPSGSLNPALQKIARQLWRSRSQSLVVSGSNDVEIQMGVNAINSILGNIGSTIDLDNPSLQKQGNDEAFAKLVKEMESGEVGALLVWGANPAYDNPLADRFKKGLKKVPFSLSFNNYLDETASETTAVSPDLNYLESWTDAQPKSNLYHLAQPLIAPLFDNRAFQDSLLRWMNASQDYFAYLQDNWTKVLFPKQNRFLSPKKFWNQSVHNGFFTLPEESVQPYRFTADLEAVVRSLNGKISKNRKGFSLKLYESLALRDGRHANNPWDQECPDPVTKVTWDNYLQMAPQTAERLGIRQGDVVRLKMAKAQVELPVHLQPGLFPENLSVALGYGRKKAGKVGNHVGEDLYPFVSLIDGTFRYSGQTVELETTGKRAKLATTQTHGSMEGRPIIKETTLEEWVINPRSGNMDRVKIISLWPQWKTGPEKWGMAIDLNACTGCSACVVSCQVENNVPVVGKEEVWRRREMHWLRIDRYYTGDKESPEVAHQPMLCQHCENAPCETVCPVLATVHSSDGLNQQIYNRCVGTRYCANNCPYKVRRFNWFDYADNPKFDYYLNDKLGKMVLNPDVVVRSRGVMEKCSMCIQRIQAGKLKAKQEGRKLKDGDIQMACQQSCPSKAIVFGNLKDPESEVSKLVKNGRHYGVLEELNVQPAIGYLTKVRNKG